jgi:hypothetical protein
MEPKSKATPPIRHGPRLVTDSMRDEYRALSEQDKVLLEVEHTYGKGRGVEPYGYKLTKLKTIIERSEECECGYSQAIYKYTSGKATCSPGNETVTCNQCGRVHKKKSWY